MDNAKFILIKMDCSIWYPTSGATGTGAVSIAIMVILILLQHVMDTDVEQQTSAMATSEQQQYLVQELTQVEMEYLNMMYQQAIQLYQQKD